MPSSSHSSRRISDGSKHCCIAGISSGGIPIKRNLSDSLNEIAKNDVRIGSTPC